MNAAHQPSDENRARVRDLSAFGVPQDQIARRLGVCEKTLRKHYRDALDEGASEAHEAVVKNLWQYAAGKKGSEKGQVVAAIFWTKTRLGWRETVNVNDVTDPNAGARDRLASKLGAKLPPPGAEDGSAVPDPIGRA